MTSMITIISYLKMTVDNIINIIMFYEFRNSKMTRFNRELILRLSSKHLMCNVNLILDILMEKKSQKSNNMIE